MADPTCPLAALVTPAAIARVALPSLVTTLAPPVCAAVELALLARAGGSSSSAAFAAVNTALALFTTSLNFLVTGVASQVGAAAGQGQWAAAAARARIAVLAAASLGVVGAAGLAAAGPAVWSFLKLADGAAPAFWRLRCCGVPLTLVTSAVTGCLNGYGNVRTAASLAGVAAVVETAAVAALLRGRSGLAAAVATPAAPRHGRPTPTPPLVIVGAVGLAVSAVAAGAGLVAVRRQVASHSGRTNTASPAGTADGDDATTPLLVSQDVAAPPPLRALIADFVRGSAALAVRSLTLQLTFNAAMAVAARRGTAALAAHAAASQLWLATSYTCDALESAAIVLGSRVFAAATAAADGTTPSATAASTDGATPSAAAARAAFATLAARLLAAGVAIAVAASAALLAAPRALGRLFVGADGDALALLLDRTLAIVAAAQPLCAATFISDGLVYAVHAFGGARDVMVASFVVGFAPVLATGAARGTPGVWFIWLAKLAHNAGRLVGNTFVVCRAWKAV